MGTAAATTTTGEGTGKKGVQPSDIGGLVAIDEVRLSPDGTLVAAVVTTIDAKKDRYRRCIWLGPVDGSTPLAPFTAGAAADGSPRFSPDGRHLAFVSHRADPDEKPKGSTLHVAPVAAGGEVRTVCAWPEEIGDVAWSPDGTTLAFGARVPDEARTDPDTRKHPPRRITTLFTRTDGVGWTLGQPRHLFVVAADGTDPVPTRLTDGEPGTGGLAWHPDGTRLAFDRAGHDGWDLDQRRDLWTVAVDPDAVEPEGADGGGFPSPVRLTPTETTLSTPSWSPSGERLGAIWSSGLAGGVHAQVAVVDPATGEHRLVTTSLDRQCQVSAGRAPVWLDDDRLLVTVEDGGGVHLHEVAVATGATTPVVVGERQVTAYDAAAGVTAFADTDHAVQGRVVVLVDGAERVLARLGERLTRKRALAAPVRFRAPAGDGAEVDAWYAAPVPGSTPEDEERHPTLLLIHGGPFTQYGVRFFDEVQLYAAAGFGVVFANPRGSSGGTQAWGEAINFPGHPTTPGTGWGGVDADDLVAVMDEACRRFDAIDPDRLGILGGSYGGYMTTWLAGHDPDGRWKAACSERSANDLAAIEVGASDIATVFRGYTGVDAAALITAASAALYRERSATTYAADITCPMLIMHSEGDLRCPIDQADALFVALRVLGRTVEYVRFPGESHGLSRGGSPTHRTQRAEAIIEWFSRWLRAEAEA